MIITNAGLLVLYFLGKLVLNIFVGRLRDIELEEIIDQGRMFLLDTIFFLLFSSPTVDNVEVGAMVLSRYITLVLVLKLLHLISHIRINHMFELDRPKTITIIRMAALLNILLVIDVSLVFKYYGLLSRDSTLRLWVFFESVSLFVSCSTSIGKYLVHIVDLKLQAIQLAIRQEEDEAIEQGNTNPPGMQAHNFVWSNKNAILFYMEVFGDMCSLFTYLLFIILFLVLNPSRIPLYIMGDIFHVLKALYSKLSSFRRYRKLTKNIENRLQEATIEEIERIDTCIVCRDILYIGSKKIPCGHVFHLDCLKSWFIQQQTCPICRSPITIQDEEAESSTFATGEDSNPPEVSENHLEANGNAVYDPVSSNQAGTTLNPDSVTALGSSSLPNSSGTRSSATLAYSSSGEENSRSVKRILKNWLTSERRTTVIEEPISKKVAKHFEGTKFKISNHHLFKRKCGISTPNISKAANRVGDYTNSLPPQILALQPQVLLELNRALNQGTFRNEYESQEFSEIMSEMYKRNADIWLNRINELINTKSPNFIQYLMSCEQKGNNHTKGESLSNIYESRSCRADPLRNLMDAVNNQLKETNLNSKK
ncbi:membrane associated RING finger containing protein [Cryptosporidium ubiquitum]|uniref:RING-type E3 ubiquitin transferase n=1 Tax=Cryptosporidium ubiquitum TaxID=857276 RepID=A0A1J4MJP6_9CRYT|nr:membrane associated RING finger containing protein [Cryptosporidium ubiquitum]OII73683.1 membrane associated RING finger containing protein [Cryptosporidium ubiquitum]